MNSAYGTMPISAVIEMLRLAEENNIPVKTVRLVCAIGQALDIDPMSILYKVIKNDEYLELFK